MEKISGILPASARITNVDFKNSGVARSGSPSFGRPQGTSTVAQNEMLTAKRSADNFKELMNIREQNADPDSAIVDKITNDFFMRKGRPDKDDSNVELPQYNFGPNADMDPNTEDVREDLDMPELGAYLDVNV